MKILILLLLIGCKTPPDSKKLYKKNMLLEVNGVQAVGVLVAERGSVFTIKADFKKKINRIKVDTCHRNYDNNDIGKEWSYFYKKNEGIEDKGMCKMKITALNNFGVNAWGLIEFKNESDHNLEAVLKCNGAKTKVSGVSICQSKAGLRQSITSKRIPIQILKMSVASLSPMTKKHTSMISTMEIVCSYLNRVENTTG